MSRTPSIGVLLGSAQPPSELLAAARLAESAGFDEVWVGEDYFYTGGIAAVASVLASIRLPVGLGIAPVAGRHPALLATELATIAGMHPGRLHAGIGAGVPEWLEPIGVQPRSPLGSVRDTLRAVRTLLEGKVLNVEHETFVARGVSLAHPPAQVPPLYLGAGGPKALRLSGSEADGTVLSVLAGPEYVRWACERLAEGGAGSEHRLVVYAFCAIDSESAVAREMLRDLVAFYLLTGPRNPLSEIQGIADEAEELSKLGIEAATAQIPDRWLEELTVAGTPEECAAKVRGLADAGADAVALCFPPDQPFARMLELVARDLLPRLDHVLRTS